MKRFQLTLVFIAFSAITIGAGAAAMNALTASSAEKSLLSLTERQSERDARFIATLVSQLLASDAPDETVTPPVQGAPSDLQIAPAFANATLLIDAPTVLEALDIADLAIYDTTGRRVWSSTVQGTMAGQLDPSRLESAMAGSTVSGIIEDALPASEEPGENETIDLVYTFVPLIGEESGRTIQVLGVSRPVPSGVEGLVESSRETVLMTTLISLSGVFLVLLAFVMAADVKIWRRNEAAIALERARSDELKNLSEAKSLFLAEVTHELNNPLTSITSFIDLIMKNRAGNLSERQMTQLAIARRNGDQMSRLVSDLSDAARVERGAIETLPTQFECSRIFEDTVMAMSHQLEKRGQELICDLPGDMGVMTADRGRLIQVISNLLGNASKYSKDGSRIWLSARVESGALHVTVKDEGIGIAREHQKNLFTLFYRVDNEETRQVRGTGIGLVLVKEIIEAHKGTVELESEPGVGTTVMFHVPLEPSNNSNSIALRMDRSSDPDGGRMVA